jgi:putative ABC transport system permease protein
MDALVGFLVLVVLSMSSVIVILALRNVIVFKMAARNFARHKVQSVIVICGLMIGTSIISSALVVQDTLVYAFENDTYHSKGEVDEEIWGLNSLGTRTYFNISIYESIARDLENVSGIEAVAPVISDTGSILDWDTKLGEPSVAILGLDSDVLRETVFGDLDGSGFYPDSMADGTIAINSRLADELDAAVGHTVQLSYGAKDPSDPLVPFLMRSNFLITKVINEEDLYGKANYDQQKTVFFELDTLQELLNRGAEINNIWISNEGDHVEGTYHSKKVNDDIQDALDTALGKSAPDPGHEDQNLEVQDVKADLLESGRTQSEGVGTLFLIFGMFSIIAGIVLIINIFVMLAEERKSEMGIARAVGMKSKHLVRLYVFEGGLYAYVAAIAGALLGLFFGWSIIQAFDVIFGAAETTSEGGFALPFHFTWETIVIAFCVGLLITFLTIFLTSLRITKLNIIRAIRRIPEPRTSRIQKGERLMGVGLVVSGIICCSWGYLSKEGAGWMVGLPFIFIGSALVVHRWTGLRAAFTTAGVLIILVMISPFDIPVMSEADFDGAEAFILSGVFLVLAGIFIVMFNSDVLLLGLQYTIGRGRSTRAVLKTAISYPMDNKFKTAMTLGMFALIIFTVTVIAMIAGMQASQGDAMLREQSGGYDVMGVTNPRTPFSDLSMASLPAELQDRTDGLETISSAMVIIADYDRREGMTSDFGPTRPDTQIEQYYLLGVSSSFLKNNGFSLKERDERFSSDREAWEALDENDSYCIVDGSRMESMSRSGGDTAPADEPGVYVGGEINITDYMGQGRTRTLKVIGIMDQDMFFQGIIVKEEVVRNEYGGLDNIVVIKLKPGEDADAYSKDFESAFLELGVQKYDMKGMISDTLEMSNNVMYLMEGFLGIGLLVGIAGIGIISYRNVIERRQQIGMLRAIGGILLGIGIGWTIYEDGMDAVGASFVIPWMNLLAIAVVAYVSTLIFTFKPSLKASKIPPAEALRYIE